MDEQKKRTAPGATTPKAEKAVNAKQIINESVPENEDFVKSDTWQEIETLFDQLSPAGKERVIKFTKLLCLNHEFNEAFRARFGYDLEVCSSREVDEFVAAWEERTT